MRAYNGHEHNSHSTSKAVNLQKPEGKGQKSIQK